MSCGDVLSLEDLQTAKKHQVFEAEVITGKAGGTTGGIDIDYATNQVTGQTQKTLPAVLRDAGFRPAAFTFATGGVLAVGDSDVAVLWPTSSGGDGAYYIWKGAYPKTVPANSTPASSGGVSASGWLQWGDITFRAEATPYIDASARVMPNVAAMRASVLLKVADVILTREYHSGTGRGGAIYDVFPAGTVADNIVDHALQGGLVAVLRWSRGIEIDQCGAKPNDLTADFSAAFNAAQAKIAATYPCGFVVFGGGVYRHTSTLRIKEGVKMRGAGNAGFKISQNPTSHIGTTATIIYSDIATYASWAITTDNRVVASGAPLAYDKIVNLTENDSGVYTQCVNVEMSDFTLITDKPLYGGINFQMSPNSKTDSVSVVGPDIGVQRNCCWGYSDVQLFVIANFVALARAWCNGGSSSGYLTVYAQNGSTTKVFSRDYPFADVTNAGTTAYPLAAARATTCDYIANSGCEGSDNLILEHSEYAAQYIKSTVSYSGQIERTLNQNGFLCDDTNLNVLRIGVFQVVPFSNIQKSYVTSPGVVTSGDVWRTVDTNSILHVINHIGYGNRQQPNNNVFLSGMPAGRMGFTPVSNLLSNTEVRVNTTGWQGDVSRVSGVATFGAGLSLPVGATTRTVYQAVAVTLANNSPMVFSAFVDTSGLSGGTVNLIISLHKAGAFLGNQVLTVLTGFQMKRYQIGIESFGDADEIRCIFSSTGTTGTFSPVATKFQLEYAKGPDFLIASEYRGNP